MNLRQLREKLDKGFFVDNLYEMSRLCKQMALESESPALLFILQNIFSGIADYWDEKPIAVEDARFVERELKGHLEYLISAIEGKASDEKTPELANKAISSYLFLFGKKPLS